MLALVLDGSGHLRLLYNVVRVLLDAVRFRSLMEREFASSPALVAVWQGTVITGRRVGEGAQKKMRIESKGRLISGSCPRIDQSTSHLPEQKKFAISDVIWITIFAIYMGRVQPVQMAVGRVQDV